MDILVIGNGFDLAHGLSTKYTNFLDFLDFIKYGFEIKEDKLKKSNIYSNEIICDKKKNKVLSILISSLDDEEYFRYNTDNLKEVLKLIKDNFWVDLFMVRKNKIDIEKKGWIDFECEISYIIKNLEVILGYEVKEKVKDFHGNEIKLENIIKKLFNFSEKNNFKKDAGYFKYYEKEIIDKLIDDLNRLIRSLEIYLLIVEESSGQKIDLIESLQIDAVLSFNYTHTYRNLYYSNDNKIIKYDYIHGEINKDGNIKFNNMVLGIDEYLKDDLKDEKLDFVEFKKYFQRIYKKTGCEYKKWIEEIKEYKADEHNLYVFGHSLDTTDKDVLEELIMLPNVKTTVFYHDKDSHIKYISNMVKIIKQDNLINKVHGTNPSLIFFDQNENFIQSKNIYSPIHTMV